MIVSWLLSVANIIFLAMTTNTSSSSSSPPLLLLEKKAIVLIDPVTEYKPVISAALAKNLIVMAVQLSPVEDRMRKFVPTPATLKEAGVHHVLDLQDRDVYACVHALKVLQQQPTNIISIQGVVPLAETAVDFSDTISAMLGVPHHNPLELAISRRDKGFMKEAVRSSGLRVAQFARLALDESSSSSSSLSSVQELVQHKMTQLGMDLPVVVKTPQGFSSTDVYICKSFQEAVTAVESILNSIGPDGRRVRQALLEEYIGGTEFAVNLMACQETIVVTDVWKYVKNEQARYSSAEICNPNDPLLESVVSYAVGVAKAVGIHFGAGHVELKAQEQADGCYLDPVMMEVGARLSGGRKATMTQAVLNGKWDPFAALIDSHSGIQPQVMDSYTPKHFVRHLFLPIDKSGTVERVHILNMSELPSMHSHAMIVKEGDIVKETTDITSCAGFVWLVGDRSQVETDTQSILSSFRLQIKET
jgi:D-alanine-D-alanine ligase-like ATP-grasp enzyme